MLGGDVFIFQSIGLLLRMGEHILRGSAHAQLRAGGFGKPILFGGHDLLNPGGVRSHFFENRLDHATIFRQQRRQQMQRQQLDVVLLLSQLLGTHNRFLGFDGEFIESHGSP